MDRRRRSKRRAWRAVDSGVAVVAVSLARMHGICNGCDDQATKRGLMGNGPWLPGPVAILLLTLLDSFTIVSNTDDIPYHLFSLSSYTGSEECERVEVLDIGSDTNGIKYRVKA
uniref:Uncharacterized protein n=1 Tax=Oryza sativa subsp. japonica TaxID=39947 RepID=Q5Z9C6_ORYSJ|nr:hypothetical protein [Oryza sativa Japonica Group]